MIYYIHCCSFFSKKKELNKLSRASHHYHVRSKFIDFHFTLMASNTDEKYDVVKHILKSIRLNKCY